jgi:dTDP-4-amino-4,6-dideoxygalactose transaminase
MRIDFNRPARGGREEKYVLEALRQPHLSGDGPFSKRCQKWFEDYFCCEAALLTPSCTAALEMAAILINIQPGDEVIIPSYTFVSTANAFILRGATVVFVDIRPDTLNVDELKIRDAITKKTKAIVVVHYAGVACEMNAIMEIARDHSLFVIEDAAQSIYARYEDKPLGTFGHLAAISFHETKNLTSGGEGGLLIVNHKSLKERAEIIREKGTNRSQFFRGQIDKYTWVDVGSSFLPSELQAAYLWAQLEMIESITQERVAKWLMYFSAFSSCRNVELARIPTNCEHNGHIFYLKLPDLTLRSRFINEMKNRGVMCLFHYIPLHSSPYGSRVSRFHGNDSYTTQESQRLVRLPIWHGLRTDEIQFVINATLEILELL